MIDQLRNYLKFDITIFIWFTLIIPLEVTSQSIFKNDFEADDTNLDCGKLLSGSIDIAGGVDQLTFTGQANDRIFITLVETSNWGGNSGRNDARFTLLSPGADPVSDLANTGTFFDSDTQVEYKLPEGGQHILKINANNLVSTGEYNVGVTCVSPVSPIPVTLNCSETPTLGTVMKSGEVDLFSFAGQANDRIFITLVETSNWGGNSGRNDARFTLLSPGADPVSDLANTGTFFDSDTQVEYELPESGRYLIKVNANNLVSVGEYNIGVACIDL